jgi:hypothetical protein
MATTTRITYRDPVRGERAHRRGVVDGDVLAALLLTAPAFVWIVARTIARHQSFDAGATLSAAIVVVALAMLVRTLVEMAVLARSRRGRASSQSR